MLVAVFKATSLTRVLTWLLMRRVSNRDGGGIGLKILVRSSSGIASSPR